MKKIFSVILLTALLAAALTAAPAEKRDKLSLKLKEVPLIEELNMIALQYNLNLVVSGDVAGAVTIHLEEVDIFNALNAILNSNGYNYFIRDGVIVVKSNKVTADGELASKLITLKYIAPNTAVKALETRLSEMGQIIVLDKNLQDNVDASDKFQPNRILITDRANLLGELERLVKEIDVPERMIQIEAKIIETTLDNNSKLGFLWPSSVSGSLSNAEGWSTDSETDATSSNNIAGFHDIENETWTWGKVSVQQLDLVLDFLKQDDNTKLISDPHITTLENHEAEIKIETIVPIQTINRFSEGAVIQDIVTFQDEEIGISLKVTPRINEAGLITMEVNPVVEDIIGYAGTDDNRKPITSSRSITTQITVNDGESIALGGLIKENEIQSEQKLPLLGYIPILGKLLFTHTTTEKAKTDLIILITPRIL